MEGKKRGTIKKDYRVRRRGGRILGGMLLLSNSEYEGASDLVRQGRGRTPT